MFGTSILDYSARLRIAKHGFESVTHKLARDYQRYKEVAARHGIEISARRVRKVLDTVEEEEKGISAWRRVLEQTTGALLRQSDEAEAAKAESRPAGRVAGAGPRARGGEARSVRLDRRIPIATAACARRCLARHPRHGRNRPGQSLPRRPARRASTLMTKTGEVAFDRTFYRRTRSWRRPSGSAAARLRLDDRFGPAGAARAIWPRRGCRRSRRRDACARPGRALQGARGARRFLSAVPAIAADYRHATGYCGPLRSGFGTGTAVWIMIVELGLPRVRDVVLDRVGTTESSAAISSLSSPDAAVAVSGPRPLSWRRPPWPRPRSCCCRRRCGALPRSVRRGSPLPGATARTAETTSVADADLSR